MAYLLKQSTSQLDGCGEDAAHRFLGGDASADPCDPKLDEDLISKVVPTVLVAMLIGNAITGLLFYGLGKMKNTASVIGFIPASVVAGFLTCIGYKRLQGNQTRRPHHDGLLLQGKVH
mmetsp:Transcript_28851/g.52246  ORF Transcript_28851/g.52246 Transcript_28851/m.52246 type:complete len:118 (-) Transcript_28851:340-693(-)